MKAIVIGILIVAGLAYGFFLKNPDYKPPTADEIKQEVVNKGEELAKEKINEVVDEKVGEYFPDTGGFPEIPEAIKDIVEKAKTIDLPKSEILSYQSPYGFSFKYSPIYSLENIKIVLPPGKSINAVAVVRYVREEWCSDSGLPEHCSPFLENPAIAFGVIGESPAGVVSIYLKDYIDLIESVEIAGIKAAQFYAGVEGEGIVTILVPLEDKNQTLVIQYTYDEIFDNDFYKNKKEYLGSKEQKVIVDKILGTLEIN